MRGDKKGISHPREKETENGTRNKKKGLGQENGSTRIKIKRRKKTKRKKGLILHNLAQIPDPDPLPERDLPKSDSSIFDWILIVN